MEELKHINILDECEAAHTGDASLDSFLKDINWREEEISENLFDPTQPDIPVSYTLSWKDVMFAPLGGLAGLNGQPGNGKSMTFSMLVSALLNGECEGIKCLLDSTNTSVLYIDTEMEVVNTQRAVRRIYNLVGWEQRSVQPRLTTLCLREVNDAEARWRKILKAIWQFKPTAVFLDGLIDVVKDFNDNKECQDRIYQCMAIASHYNISMWCLLHLNPGSDKAVGHLGSFLERKATDIFVTSKDKETQEFKVEHKKQRLKKAPDINFVVKDDENHYGMPIIRDSGSSAAGTRYPADPRALFATYLTESGMTGRDMRVLLNDKIGIGHTKADEYLKEMVNRGILVQDDKKRYYLSAGNQVDENVKDPF